MELKKLGTTVLHGVNVKTMRFHFYLKERWFDRIVFNFPHAGFRGLETEVHVIKVHRKLVKGFFSNAPHMLRCHGEIHVSHKTGHPYDSWGLEQLAAESSLVLTAEVIFYKEDYPGYNQKRGDGAKCDKAFKLEPCRTFKFQCSEAGVSAKDQVLIEAIEYWNYSRSPSYTYAMLQ